MKWDSNTNGIKEYRVRHKDEYSKLLQKPERLLEHGDSVLLDPADHLWPKLEA